MTLTPYDTGERLEPRPWVSRTTSVDDKNRDMFGKVDFDNEESATELTIYVERMNGRRVIHIEDHTGETYIIAHDDGYDPPSDQEQEAVRERDEAAIDPWENHSDFPVKDWKYEVANGDTRLGYAAWREHQLEIREEEPQVVWIVWGNGESATPGKYAFDTQVELDAFLLAVSESDGWDNWEQFDTQEEFDAWQASQQVDAE